MTKTFQAVAQYFSDNVPYSELRGRRGRTHHTRACLSRWTGIVFTRAPGGRASWMWGPAGCTHCHSYQSRRPLTSHPKRSENSGLPPAQASFNLNKQNTSCCYDTRCSNNSCLATPHRIRHVDWYPGYPNVAHPAGATIHAKYLREILYCGSMLSLEIK